MTKYKTLLALAVFVGGVACATLTGSPAIAAQAGGLPALEARVTALEALVASLSPPVTAVTVVCADGDTISDALSQGSSAVPLTITIVGTCPEAAPVEIRRDAVTIQGNSATGTDTLVGGFDILGSDRITIKNLTLLPAAAGPTPGTGILARRGSSVLIDNVTVSGFSFSGIAIRRHSFARIDNTDVTTDAIEAAVFASDGSTLLVTNSTFISENATQFRAPAVGLFRMSSARFDGGNNEIRNTNTDIDPTKALAINILDVSNLRIQDSGNTVTGNILLESNSAADFRELTITGQIRLGGQSHTTMNNNASVIGNIFVDTQSLLEAFALSGPVTGTVTCTSDSAVSGGAVGGFTLVGCPII